MSLIALTDQLRAGRSMARTLLLLVALIGAVVVSLLAMHSLNTHTAATDTDHHTTVAAEVAGADDPHTGIAAMDESCAYCGTNHSDMLTMACVLALLATVLLLARPRRIRQRLSIFPRPQPATVVPLSVPGLRPPSLTALCISRT